MGMIRDSESVGTLPAVTVRGSDLLEAVCVALESGEWTQITNGRVYGWGNERCAYGVMYEVMARAGIERREGLRSMFRQIVRASDVLGQPIDAANDAGVPFVAIAAALRQAREDVE
jgi:hypothetical protein